MPRRLPAIALVVLATGCARERVAYELTLHSPPVSQRTPRRAYHEPFPASAYAHGDPRHRCDARCDGYWPDVYPHGHADHHCDTSCASYEPPRPASAVTYRYQTPTHVTSPLTGTSAGVQVTPSSTVVVYAHGHARHRCDTSCAGYVWPHGHARHRCGSTCTRVYPHGHSLHVCGGHCVPSVALRLSTPRVEVRIGHPHGDRSHICSSACSFYTAPSTSYVHGHRLHACHRGCALFSASLSTPSLRLSTSWRSPTPRSHERSHRHRARGGLELGFGIRLR